MPTAKLSASTIGAEIVCVPLTTAIQAPADVPSDSTPARALRLRVTIAARGIEHQSLGRLIAVQGHGGRSRGAVPANDTVPLAGTSAKDQLLPFAQLPVVPWVVHTAASNSAALYNVPVDASRTAP